MTDRLNRRTFLQLGAAALATPVVARSVSPRPAARSHSTPSDFELEDITLAELQDAMRAGRHTARSIGTAYLARIAELDPKLHAVIETNPDALAIADGLDAERKSGGGRVRGPLHGITVLVKDNIA